MKSFKVIDKGVRAGFDTEGGFPSEAQADAYILRRKNEILSGMRQDEPSRHWEFKEVCCEAERKEYWLMENDEVYGMILIKLPTY